jgi:hypothetical protein
MPFQLRILDLEAPFVESDATGGNFQAESVTVGRRRISEVIRREESFLAIVASARRATA